MEHSRVALDSDGSVSDAQIKAFAQHHRLHVDVDLGRVDEQIGVLEIREGTAVVILPVDPAEHPDGATTIAASAAATAGFATAGHGASAAAVGIGAMGAAAAPLAGLGLATALITKRLRDRQAAQRRRSGQRRGRRPHKPRREVLERIADCLEEGASYQVVARELEQDRVLTPDGKDRWWAATVKRLVDTSLKETRVVLSRLGGLLAEIEEAGSVSERELAEAGARHNFHHHRLLKTFESHWSTPHVTEFTPPIERRGQRYVLSDGGRRLLEIWRRSEALDDRLEDVMLSIYRRGGKNGVTPAQYESICTSAGVALAEVPVALVAFRADDVTFRLTTEGVAVAQAWARVVDRDPRKRLDIDFWPETQEESDRWDWEDDPLAPAASGSGARSSG